MELIDGGADDVEEFNEEGKLNYLVYTDPTTLSKVSNSLKQMGFNIESAEIIMKPITLTEVTDKEKAEQVLNFTDRLESHDDVQKVYANFDIAEGLLD